ncbi:hypothetical protein [Anaerococcus porci]|nr:hypothetical protein [Anaerococcus porci]
MCNKNERLYELMIKIAKETKYNAGHWYRYLRKFIKRDKILIDKSTEEKLLESSELTNFQKVSLKLALDETTKVHEYIINLNEKTKKKNFNKLMEKIRENEIK